MKNAFVSINSSKLRWQCSCASLVQRAFLACSTPSQYILSSVIANIILLLNVFEMFQVNSHLSVNSYLIYMISIYGFYFKVHPLRFWYRGALLLGNGEKKTKKTKTKVYFCRVTILCSLVDVRSWVYKTKAVGALLTCCNSLLTDGWEINGSSSKENTLLASWSKTFGKMSTISKWQSGVCHCYYFCTVS